VLLAGWRCVRLSRHSEVGEQRGLKQLGDVRAGEPEVAMPALSFNGVELRVEARREVLTGGRGCHADLPREFSAGSSATSIGSASSPEARRFDQQRADVRERRAPMHEKARGDVSGRVEGVGSVACPA
jgi:hypothetical protein